MSNYQLHYVLTREIDSGRDPELILMTPSVGPLTEVEAIGIIDYSNSGLLTCLVDRLLTEYAPRWLVLDLAEVRLLDAAGITALLRSQASCADQGGRLILRNPSPMTCRVLDITGTAGQFDVRTSAVVAPAIASNGDPGPVR
jgi:anti-anti-sigma factor